MHMSSGLWNVAPVLHKPKGIVEKRKLPLRQMKAVLSASLGLTGAWWYELRRSNLLNHSDPAMASRYMSVRGSGYASFLVTLFSRRLSVQQRNVWPLLRTKNTLDSQGLPVGSIVPWSTIFLTCWRIASQRQAHRTFLRCFDGMHHDIRLADVIFSCRERCTALFEEPNRRLRSSVETALSILLTISKQSPFVVPRRCGNRTYVERFHFRYYVAGL